MNNILVIIVDNNNFSFNINSLKDLPSKNIFYLYTNNLEYQFQNINFKFLKIQDNINNLFEIKDIDLNKFDYLLYLPNKYNYSEINLIEYINLSISIFSNNTKINQIIYKECQIENEKIIINNQEFELPILHTYDYSDLHTIFNKIKLILSDKENKYTENNQKINYINYAKKIYNEYYFKLDFSLIKLDKIKEIRNFPIFHDTLEERSLGKYLFKEGLQSLYLNKKISLNEVIKCDVNNTDNVTLVTGFFKANAGSKKHKYDYLDKAKKTLELKQNMYIFVSEDLVDFVKDYREKLNLLDKTKIIQITYDDLYMTEYFDKIQDNVKKNISPYDNPIYIMCVASRNNYLRKAIEENHFNNEYFIWVDFGLSHIVNMDDSLLNLNNRFKIRIAWIARYRNNSFVYNHECLGGGIFGGYKDSLLKLINLHDEYFIKLTKMGFNINNDKLLFFIYEEYPELFDIYFSSYSGLFERFNH